MHLIEIIALVTIPPYLSVWTKSITGRSIEEQQSLQKTINVPISIISDQDSAANLGNSIFYSTLSSGTLHIDLNQKMKSSVSWKTKTNFTSGMNNSNRGMELSALIWFNDRLLTVDDKTGIIYWLKGSTAIPWVVLADGDGTEPSPFKGEWLAIKDDLLYCGGYGKEYTFGNGTYMNDRPMFVKTVSKEGAVQHVDWKSRFIRLREVLDIHFPGYMIHESGQWSKAQKRWFFLPRHMSKLHYDKDTAYANGANVLISTSECFCDISFVRVGKAKTTRGFSAFKFVPNTNNTVIVALKSEEIPDVPLKSFIMVFNVLGEIIMPETAIPGNFKYEGIEFYDFVNGKMFEN